MLTRVLLIALFLIVVTRIVRHLLRQALSEGRPGRPSALPRGERMARDPVCGTFVLPSRALSVGDGGQTRYFCSEQCRAAYQRQPSGRHASSGGKQ